MKEEELEGNHLVISYIINKNSPNNIPTYALIDCGATSYVFVDDEFARYHFLPRYRLKTETELEVIDGRPIKSGNITHMIKISLSINGHEERLPAFITHLGYYPLVLGKPWPKRHDVSIRFATHTVIFDLPYCLNNCAECAVQIKGITIDPPERIGATPPTSPLPPMLSALPLPTSPPPLLSIAMISTAAFRRNTRKRSAYICTFKMMIVEIDRAIARLDGAVVNDEEAEEEVRIKALVPEEYHEFLPLFTEVVHNVLLPHHIYDHSIPLKEGSQPPFGPLYSLSRNELIAVREWLDKNLRRGWI